MSSSPNSTALFFEHLNMAPFLTSGLVALSSFIIGSLAQQNTTTTTSFTNTNTSLTLLYQNNLNASDDTNHLGALLLATPATAADARIRCAALSESLLPITALEAHAADFQHALGYLAFAGRVAAAQQYHVQDAVLTVQFANGQTMGLSTSRDIGAGGGEELPVLCTQSSGAGAGNEVRVPSGQSVFVGYRDQKSFRFLGIPYANRPVARFRHSSVYEASPGEVINATTYGADCAQSGDAKSSEDCLFLNIQTPYLPLAASTTNNPQQQQQQQQLRPVMFSIHGGGFTGGNGAAGLDGGNMASRDDIVSVQLNYRLSTLGFLAVPNTTVRGNFGIGDQITALRWVQRHIASFGGDPARVTIIGESAGAGSVRALLGSPVVIREGLIAGAVAQSNLGGGVLEGGSSSQGDYATTYSSYLTVDEAFARAGGETLFRAVGCGNQTTLDAQVECLRTTASAKAIVGAAQVARYVVQDGELVDTEQLIVSQRNGSAAYVPVIFGTTGNDGASFCNFPPKNTTSGDLVAGVAGSLTISTAKAREIVDSGLFPYYDSGNATLDVFNVSQRVSTDLQFRCVDEATVYAAAARGVFPASYYYDIQRTYEGYDPLGLGAALNGGLLGEEAAEGNYFRLHGSDLGFTYGNQNPLRDARDLAASRLISGYYAAFARTGNPNIDEAYLVARGYDDVLAAVKETGPWEAVTVDGSGQQQPMAKRLDYPATTVPFPEMEQCAFLNYSLSYYLDGGA